jgi:3-isopropylmalate dehydratase/3-isopropylmalate/(R)-2-methylmalate dehydratase small subunit
MQPFDTLEAIAAPLPIANLDTDQIIPKQFLSTVERTGLGKGLLYDLRFTPEGAPKPDFVLNQPHYHGAGVLVAGPNFGCGSSREHAPWALIDFGFRCVIGESFADIFYNNCFNNALLPITLPAPAVAQLMDEARGGNHRVRIDLPAQTVTSPSGAVFTFEIEAGRKRKLLKGLDDIGVTLGEADAIARFEALRSIAQPWLKERAS